MSQFDRFAHVQVCVDEVTLALGDALDRVPADLHHPLWGVVAAWDGERGRHVLNWDLGWVLVDVADDDWPRRHLLFQLAACEPLDLDLVAAALEAHPVLRGHDLRRERGGRVRPCGDERWVAEHGPVLEPTIVATTSTSESALASLTQSCELGRAQLRARLRDADDELLCRVSTAPWWRPRYDVWSPPSTPARRRDRPRRVARRCA